jgi:two-component system OmpR family sensor kinase
MRGPFASGRLFYKVFLALCASMLLSMAGVWAFLRFVVGTVPPPPPPPAALIMWGHIPLLPLLSGLVAILVTGIALAWYITKPLRAIQHALRQVAQGSLDVRLQHLMQGRTDEIADVAQDFDAMVAQLQRLTESRQRLLHDVSHELRSPLSRMQAALGLMKQEPASAEAFIERIERESQRLDVLIEELLTLHRLEAAPGSYPTQRVDVMELLHAIAEDATFEAASSARRVTIRAEGEFVADVNGELLYRAFENVIRNAVKFTHEATCVEIDAQVEGDLHTLVVTVRDQGPGVPEDSLETIFDPFVRLEGSTSLRGTGLGLAIARRAFVLHGGSVLARCPLQGGLEIAVRLPRQLPGVPPD